MQTLIHADIFFFVTTIVVIMLGILLIFALIYIVQILRDMRDLSRKFKKEGEEFLGDMHDLREHIKEERIGFGYIAKFFGKLFKKRKN